MRQNCSSRMSARAARAKRYLDKQSRREIADFVQRHWNADGGARGRDAQSDLYYTLFAAGILQALNARIPALRLHRYLSSFGTGADLDFVHLACLARFSRPSVASKKKRQAIRSGLEKYRAQDGGFNHRKTNALRGTA